MRFCKERNAGRKLWTERLKSMGQAACKMCVTRDFKSAYHTAGNPRFGREVSVERAVMRDQACGGRDRDFEDREDWRASKGWV